MGVVAAVTFVSGLKVDGIVFRLASRHSGPHKASESLAFGTRVDKGLRQLRYTGTVKVNWNRNMDLDVQEEFSHRKDDVNKMVNVQISGRVQGVFYRNWTVDEARKLGLNGWVRNRRDGTVEAVFSGEPKAVDTLVEKCRTGPPGASVIDVKVSSWSDPVSQGFLRKPTV